jgi:hypothetical protein
LVGLVLVLVIGLDVVLDLGLGLANDLGLDLVSGFRLRSFLELRAKSKYSSRFKGKCKASNRVWSKGRVRISWTRTGAGGGASVDSGNVSIKGRN